MVRILELVLTPQQEEHIWTKHYVTPDEVEEVCFGDPWVLRGREGSYVAYGQTDGGRYLAIFLYPRGHGVYSIATAREMTEVERHRYHQARGG